MYVYDNAGLTGALPAAWSQMPSVEYMDLQKNGLTGTLPAAWADLSTLEVLYLNDNQLTGTLPAAWSKLSRLTELDLSGNRFCGCEPDSWKTVSVLHDAVKDTPVAWANCSTANVCSASETLRNEVARDPLHWTVAALVAVVAVTCLIAA
ncbi:surface membrane protein gp46-like protein [Strigomonas culicis]|uniref:Surface membrane protein gp46-like protein n=1 Tax=Strigomonas culicis TaxID=28005 RepID=S9TJG8_9TRYP|nr:surface membrane protein gp46-like protein [Strigomonas culicis]|eukprot:EPY18232.1 surface membrane protein gp46-like protein [Strigomonas culicis]